MNKLFKLKENGTTVKTEIIAGFTTFMTIAYILAVNPAILSSTGMDKGAVFTATVVSSIIATLVMAFLANLPFALAPGMGLNVFFAYTVVLGMGYSWQTALTAVFIEGVIFLILTIFNIREAIINSIPINIKRAISVGIGLFIAFIGLQNSGIIVNNDSTLVGLGNIISPAPLCTIFGIILTTVLLSHNVKGAILIGALATTILGIPLGITTFSPSLSILPPSLAPIAFKLDFSNLLSTNMIIVLFTFLFVDMFDTVGSVVGVCTKANMLTRGGEVPRCKQALFADAVGTVFGAAIGTSTVTSFVESSSGVGVGGRTGLTAVTAGVLFILSIFISPLIISAITNAVTAPALVVVGVMMAQQLKGIDWDDLMIASAAFLTVLVMVLGYSISNGIAIGFVVYTVGMIGAGKAKDIHPSVWILDVIFLIYFWVTFA